ncbi:hypothetical protein OIE62_27055 [Streptomyces scopuliridis]|uniref:Uncharacterized protein n=2 Tax=Streptomyces scopuliridis TaxID=452529 RepID=A0A2T7TA84_9ACTN|nr:hypothetical protein [Streptomyces scopuliridis]PVE12025.1 hypothetical protein Y717_06335 [Streptomyces scopuliridis RB72]WSB33728.1 hypothetical protein OG949_13175 [Streptomyces scopuliridis]WSB98001.1 hypothetical protein OG835_13885 [Streptomyces scopuliridis]WSC08297.1 hypothetical protein OIE62_27055 [Streptomyces scopuliridis]
MDRHDGQRQQPDQPRQPQQPQGFGPPPTAYAPVPQQPHPAYGPPPPAPWPQPPAYPQPSPYPQYGAQQPPAGPEFLAADRRNAVVVDAAGVSFEANGLTADFAWHDIHTVHYKAGSHGHVLMVAVVLPDGRFFECAVNARKSAKLQEWFGLLAPVLGAYTGGGAP